MPPTTQSLRHPLTRAFHFAPRIKTARRFTAKNPWWQNDFLVKNRIKFLKTITNIWVGVWFFTSAYNQYNTFINSYLIRTQLSYSATHNAFGPLFIRVSDNLISEDWFFAEGERFLSFWRCHRPRKRAALVMWCGWFKPLLEIRHTATLTTGAKHWHRQKAVFYVFCFCAPSIYPLNRLVVNWNLRLVVCWFCHDYKKKKLTLSALF